MSGLLIELGAARRETRSTWTAAGVAPEMAVRGLHSVSLTVREPRKTVDFMREMLGFEVVNEMEGRIRVAVSGDGPGHATDIVHSGDADWAKNGLGTVHHV